MKKLLVFALVGGIGIFVNVARAQTSATLTDLSGATPVPGPDDISLLDTSAEGQPPGLNYYFDNSAPPGQTFTTGSNPNGYLLTSLAVYAAGGGGGGITTNPQPYYLRLYSVDGTGTNAALIASYVSQTNFTFFEGDWLAWSNLSIGLQPNTMYAWSFARGRAGWELLGSDSGDEYTGGQSVLVPTAGGAMTTSTTTGYDAIMDIGLMSISSLIVNPPSFTPSNVVTNGTAVTATAAAFGAAPLYYQWQTDGGSGGTLTNIPGATSATLAINTTTLSVGGYLYDVVVTNSSYAATSAVAQLTIVLPTAPATLADEGDSILTGTYDIGQFVGGGNGDGLNYYDDNGAVQGRYTGQTFTTGTNAQGYYLSSVAIQTGGGGSSDTTTAQGYDLYIFSVNNGNATVMAHYTATNFVFTFGDWLEWSGFEVPLKANTTYAYGFGNERTNTSFQSWAALNTSPNTTDLYTNGQVCLIPTQGGPLSFGASGLSDAVFDVGLLPIGVGPDPHPHANPIAVSPSRTIAVGTQVTLTETASGQTPLSYQWLTDGGTGTLTNIPSSNASNMVVNTASLQPGPYQYQVIVNNSFGSSTSAVSTVTVLYANTTAALADLGAATPTSGANDIAQLTPASGANNPDGLNFYFDNANPPGQTFTTGSNPAGYTLSSVAIDLAGNSGNLPSGGQSYLMRIYKVNGSTATLYAVYTSVPINFTFAVNTDWLRWSGFALPLAANTTYAYTFGRSSTGSGWDNLANVSGNPYPGGEVALIPTGGGSITYGSSHSYDATFVLGLDLAGYPIVAPPVFSPSNNVYAGTPVTVTASVSGTGPFIYQWQTDGGTGTFTNIPGATSITLAVDTTGLDGQTVSYALIASNGSGATTGEAGALTISSASAPFIVQDISPSAPTVFVGRPITFSATFGGTLPITYQWQVDKGSGATNIDGQTNATLALPNLALSDAGFYSVIASNSVGTGNSSSATLTVQPHSGELYESAVLAANPLAYYPLNEPNGSQIVYDMASGNNGTNQGAAILGVPGVPNPPFLGFSSANTALATTNVANSWASAPFGRLGINNATFTAWIYPAGSQTNWAGILMTRSGGAEGGFGYNNQQMLDYTWNNGSTWSFVSGLVIPSNQWSFVAVVIQPTQATLYLYNANGLLSATNAIAHTPDVFGNNWRIGNDAAATDPGRTFQGVIDEVAVYPYSLTLTQIKQLYSASSTGTVQLNIQQSGTNVVLNWAAGTLLQANSITGPWTTNTATSPYMVAPTGQQFYRVKVQ